MKSSRTVRRAAGAVLAGISCVALGAMALPAHATPTRQALPNSSPKWTAKAQQTGNTPDNARLSFGVLLKMRNASAAQAQIKAFSDPHSATYGRHLTDAQFRAAYAPTSAQTSQVASWLRSQGLTVTSTLKSGMYVQVTGTTKQVEKAFGTQVKQYRYKGHSLHSNDGTLSVADSTPADVRAAISGVVGLDQVSDLKKPAETLPGPPEGSRTGVQPCSSYFGQKLATDKPKVDGKAQPYAVCGYTPKQMQSAYGVDQQVAGGYNGKGQTIVITDAYAAPTITQDMHTYNKLHGLPQFTKGQYTQQTPGPDGYSLVDECGGSGWYGEETLDVQAAHSMAPGAKIVYMGAPDCAAGLDNTWAAAIDNHVGDVISNSWGSDADTVADIGQASIDFYNQFAEQAALTGITVLFSASDAGDGTEGGTMPKAKTASFPTDIPYVTGVGGTSLDVNANGKRVAEWGWSNAYSPLKKNNTWGKPVWSSGGGGGPSQIYTQPWYQRGVVPDSIANYYGKGAMRATPDIALAGDPNTGLIVGETQSFPDGTYYDEYRIGGTSLASPLLSGVIAVANQRAGKPLGFLNPSLYAMRSANAGLYDVQTPTSPVYQVRTDYTNSIDASDGYLFQLETIDVQTETIHTYRGYDDITGVGSPGGAAFFNQLVRLSS